ncbi:histone-lysine N-methyltransferase setd3 isoform X2 [Fopius arisanus]|uniref:protein-histidine N-methyltransferase n=1 Tax=Fopius arisanus TaxID=64838 RepID=A0A9R1U907_9HYME|nr:PREDICTED: histone-lysine N-methyltransferase setd3 isoform X2 [Fopius arisanus]
MGRKKCHRSIHNYDSSQKKKIPQIKRKEISQQCENLLKLCSDPIYTTRLWESYLEISSILEKINRLEEMRMATTTPRAEAIMQFIEWLKSYGAMIEGVSIGEFAGFDLGIKAEKDYHANELVLEIPRKHMPQVALAIALLVEKHRENSKWKPYLSVLPRTYNTVLYMSARDMIELKGSPTLEVALKHCRNIARQYSYFNQMFQSNGSSNHVSQILKDVFTYEEYCWAVSTVMTRQNIIPSEHAGEMIHALIPMWDMCNHEEGVITTDFNINSDMCECYVKREFKQGEQIFINYGSRTNSDFFVHSGFVYPDNKNDGFKLRLGISKSDPLFQDRMKLLEKLEFPASNLSFLLNTTSEPISDQMLAFLRVFSMRKFELDHWLESSKVLDLKHRDCALDTVVETNVRKFLLARLKLLMANYPTTLEEDLKILKTMMPPIGKMIVELRASEKKILSQAIDYVEQWVKA